MPQNPPPQTLAQLIRAKFPGAYDDLNDADLERAILAKHPEYGDLPRTPVAPSEQDQADALQSSTMQQARSQAVPPELRPQARVMQQTMGGMPQFVDVPADQAQSFQAAGQRGYQTGAKVGAALTALPSAVAAPVATGLSIAGGAGGGYLARKGAEKMGASPDIADIAEGVGGVAGGTAGGALGTGAKMAARSLLFSPQNKFQPARPVELLVRMLAGQPEDSADQILQNSVDRSVQRSLLLRDARAEAGLGAAPGSPQQEAGYTPSITKVPITSQPSSPLTPQSVPGPDTSGKGNLLTGIAKRGDVRAADELMRRGRGVLYVPDNIESMSAADWAKFLAGLGNDQQ
jgi:hypothetical protein